MIGKPLVLIIEDNEDFQHFFGLVAEQSGCAYEIIYDGNQALERLKSEPIPTLVLLDHFLPGADGEEILAAARANPKWQQVPIYYMTAEARLVQGVQNYLPDAPRVDGVIEKGGDAIRQLKELFAELKKKDKAL